MTTNSGSTVIHTIAHGASGVRRCPGDIRTLLSTHHAITTLPPDLFPESIHSMHSNTRWCIADDMPIAGNSVYMQAVETEAEMGAQASLRFAIMNDLHVGVDTGGGFQNPFLTGDARTTVAATVAAINRQQPDFVLVPGDLTSNATERELAEVLGYLDGLCCPFVVCKGNHDRESPEAARRFNAAFGERAQAGVVQREVLNLPASVAILVLESSWNHASPPYPEGPLPLAVLDEGLAEGALNELERRRPEWLLVVSHYPMMSQTAYAARNQLKYAGHVEGGEELLKELSARAGAVVCFCAHNHYHHIMARDNWLQCATGALVEYPAEYRLVTIAEGCLSISTHAGAQAAVDAAPAPQRPQVQGRPEDRKLFWQPE